MTQIFGQVVRQSHVLVPASDAKPGAEPAAPVDSQRLSFAFRMMLDELEDGESIDLEGLYGVLIRDLKQPPQAIMELCVVLKARLERFGAVALPAQASSLEPDQLAAIVQRFEDRLAQQHNRNAPPTPTPAPTPTETAAAGPGDASADLSAIFSTKNQKEKRKILGASAPLVYALVGFFVLTFGWTAFRAATRADPVTPIDPAGDTRGLPCGAGSFTNGEVAFCKLTDAYMDAEKPAALETRAGITKARYEKQFGIKRLMLLSDKDKVRATY